MTYKIVVSPRAQKEIENAIDFYALNSVDAPLKFITALNDAYETLKISPFFRVSYKNIRSLTINTFPTALFLLFRKSNIQFLFSLAFTIVGIQGIDHLVKMKFDFIHTRKARIPLS
jgi:plasmid stabilization system protein ParE